MASDYGQPITGERMLAIGQLNLPSFNLPGEKQGSLFRYSGIGRVDLLEQKQVGIGKPRF